MSELRSSYEIAMSQPQADSSSANPTTPENSQVKQQLAAENQQIAADIASLRQRLDEVGKSMASFEETQSAAAYTSVDKRSSAPTEQSPEATYVAFEQQERALANDIKPKLEKESLNREALEQIEQAERMTANLVQERAATQGKIDNMNRWRDSEASATAAPEAVAQFGAELQRLHDQMAQLSERLRIAQTSLVQAERRATTILTGEPADIDRTQELTAQDVAAPTPEATPLYDAAEPAPRATPQATDTLVDRPLFASDGERTGEFYVGSRLDRRSPKVSRTNRFFGSLGKLFGELRALAARPIEALRGIQREKNRELIADLDWQISGVELDLRRFRWVTEGNERLSREIDVVDQELESVVAQLAQDPNNVNAQSLRSALISRRVLIIGEHDANFKVLEGLDATYAPPGAILSEEMIQRRLDILKAERQQLEQEMAAPTPSLIDQIKQRAAALLQRIGVGPEGAAQRAEVTRLLTNQTAEVAAFEASQDQNRTRLLDRQATQRRAAATGLMSNRKLIGRSALAAAALSVASGLFWLARSSEASSGPITTAAASQGLAGLQPGNTPPVPAGPAAISPDSLRGPDGSGSQSAQGSEQAKGSPETPSNESLANTEAAEDNLRGVVYELLMRTQLDLILSVDDYNDSQLISLGSQLLYADSFTEPARGERLQHIGAIGVKMAAMNKLSELGEKVTIDKSASYEGLNKQQLTELMGMTVDALTEKDGTKLSQTIQYFNNHNLQIDTKGQLSRLMNRDLSREQLEQKVKSIVRGFTTNI